MLKEEEQQVVEKILKDISSQLITIGKTFVDLFVSKCYDVISIDNIREGSRKQKFKVECQFIIDDTFFETLKKILGIDVDQEGQ